MKNLRGFTLVELMITIVIASVLLTTAVPSFRSIIQNNRITAHANQFLSALSLARSEAIRRGIPVTLCSSTDMAICSGNANWQNGWIIFSDASGALRALDGADAVIKVGQALEGTSALTQNGAFPDTFSFDPSGRSFIAGNTIYTLTIPDCIGDQRRTITISATGRAAVNRTACP